MIQPIRNKDAYVEPSIHALLRGIREANDHLEAAQRFDIENRVAELNQTREVLYSILDELYFASHLHSYALDFLIPQDLDARFSSGLKSISIGNSLDEWKYL